jgi:hypothetical protein
MFYHLPNLFAPILTVLISAALLPSSAAAAGSTVSTATYLIYVERCQAQVDRDISIVEVNLQMYEAERETYQAGVNACIWTGFTWGIACTEQLIGELQYLVQQMDKIINSTKDLIDDLHAQRSACATLLGFSG